MDRLKFRVWDIRRNRYLCSSDCRIDGDGELEIGADFVDIDPWYVVELCTGFKDKEGQLIYEGDIIQLNYGLPPTCDTLTIVHAEEEEMGDFSVGGWWMRNHKKEGCEAVLCKTYCQDIEVIGNIHEVENGESEKY